MSVVAKTRTEEPGTVPAGSARRAASPGKAAHRRPGSRRRLPADLAGPTVLLMSAGLPVEAWSVGRSRAGNLGDATQALFWAGLLLMFVPAAARVLGRSAATKERLVVTLALGVILQLSRTVLYPTTFAFHDEFIHANTLRLIARSHHLFGDNSLLPVSPYYPGLEIATDGIANLTGLGAHTSAVVVLMLARIVSTLAVVGVVQGVTGSTRVACVAALVYTCNPQAIFFNSQYSYESFALPLAVFVIYAFVSRYRATALWRSLALPCLALVAVVVSHHLTAMLLAAAFAVWLLIDVTMIRYRRSGDWPGLSVLAVAGAALVVGWASLPDNPTFGYLRTIGSSSAADITARLGGQDNHQLFHSSGGLASPLWEKAATVASIGLVFLAIVPAVVLIRRWARGREAILVLLGLAALAYPIIPIGHVTPGTAEVTDRASGFLFIGVGVAVALGPLFRAGAVSRLPVPLLTALFTIVFVGGVILGAGPTVGQLPGPFLVSADARSIDAANLAAADWERANLPAGTRIYADRDAGLLAAAIGGMHTVTHVGDGIDASRILLAPQVTSIDRDLIRRARIQYVVVDRRDSTGLPNVQVYIESGEYGSTDRTKPVSSAALDKFADVPGVRRVYSDGPLVIYDVRGLGG